VEGSQRGKFEVLSWHLRGGTEENQCRDLNPEPPEYDVLLISS
jgi:hypothetical protein